jgi:hypothetical protein
METDPDRTEPSEDELEDFKQELEEDPSTAGPEDAEDDDVGRLRGG